MLKKLLKYDLKSVFKYWWIAAVTTVALSVMGGGCCKVMTAEPSPPALIIVFAVLGLIFMVMGLAAFSVISTILVFVRFYKNFFTDEGYLTFTLPVKRAELLNSKLIMSVTVMLCTVAVYIVDIVALFGIGLMGTDTANEFLDALAQLFNELFKVLDFYIITYIIEILVLLLLSLVFSTLFLLCCITFASVITRKAKVITAIGIYYAANCVITGFWQMFYMFGFTSIVNWVSEVPENMYKPMAALILVGVILIFTLFCALLYILQYWMIDRKLNLN